MATTDELLDNLMKDYKKPEDLIGANGLLKQLTKRLLELAMQAELTEHLGYEKHAPQGKNTGNSRNGGYKKTITGDFGNLEVINPRDRNSTFEPIILPKGESRFTGFDDKIISMYAEAMYKLIYLALKNITKKWTMPIRDWKSALNQFSIIFEGRMPNC
jgi:putative transposase